MSQIKEQVADSLERIDQFTDGWLGIIVNAINETRKPYASITSAAIAYFALFSLFPIILLSISIASFNLGSLGEHEVLNRMDFVAPAFSQLLGENIDQIIKARRSVSSLALLGLIWSASTIFHTFTDTLNEIWQVKNRRPLWRRRGLSILIVLLFVGPILFLVSFAGSMLIYLRSFLPATLVWMEGGIGEILAIILNITLFMMLYMLLPHGIASWHEILPGAIGAGLLWELAKKAFLSFVSTYISVSNLVYGSVAAIIVFLVWAYISGLIFLFGSYLSVSSFQWKQREKQQLDHS